MTDMHEWERRADELVAWAADMDRLRGDDHVQQPPEPIHCPHHGDYLPHSLLDTECRACLDDHDRADDTYAWHYSTYPR